VVEGLQAGGEVERLGVRGGRRRHEADAARDGCQERRQQHRVEASAHAVAPGLGIRLEGTAVEAQRVSDRREQQARVVGRAGQRAPVRRRRQLGGPRRGLAPGGRVPAGAVQGDGEVDAVRHLRLPLSDGVLITVVGRGTGLNT
jgi:hypothetical protein